MKPCLNPTQELTGTHRFGTSLHEHALSAPAPARWRRRLFRMRVCQMPLRSMQRWGLDSFVECLKGFARFQCTKQVMAGESERRADIAFLFFHNTDQHSFYLAWLTLQGRAEDQKNESGRFNFVLIHEYSQSFLRCPHGLKERRKKI